MVRPLSLAQHTLYADLLEQGVDDLFDPEFPENGSVLVRPNRAGGLAEHAYYQGYRLVAGNADQGQRYARYLGRADDPAVATRIARFQWVKAARSERATTVRALIGAGMPKPDRITGRIIEALARAGLFPERAVLLGTAAYQTYGGVLGVRLSKALSQPVEDAKSRSIQIALRDASQVPRIHEALSGVDPSFAPCACSADPTYTTRFQNGGHVRVELSAASAASMLVDAAVSALVLYGPGIPVTVPAPERWAVLRLVEQGRQIGSTSDAGQAIAQTAELIEALSVAGRERAIAKALSAMPWNEVQTGIEHLPAAAWAILEAALGYDR